MKLVPLISTTLAAVAFAAFVDVHASDGGQASQPALDTGTRWTVLYALPNGMGQRLVTRFSQPRSTRTSTRTTRSVSVNPPPAPVAPPASSPPQPSSSNCAPVPPAPVAAPVPVVTTSYRSSRTPTLFSLRGNTASTRSSMMQVMQPLIGGKLVVVPVQVVSLQPVSAPPPPAAPACVPVVQSPLSAPASTSPPTPPAAPTPPSPPAEDQAPPVEEQTPPAEDPAPPAEYDDTFFDPELLPQFADNGFDPETQDFVPEFDPRSVPEPGSLALLGLGLLGLGWSRRRRHA